jgi:hypothetical protein
MKSFLITCLIVIELFNALAAFIGGIWLITANAGMPVEWLAHTPFPGFFIPGLILGVIIGGTNLFAALTLKSKYRYALEASAVAGFGMILWIFGELYFILHAHFLQVFYMADGIFILVVVMLLLKNSLKNQSTFSAIKE